MRGQPDILILGGGGMLGHKIFQRLRASTVTLATVRGDPLAAVDLLGGADVIRGVDLMDLERTAGWLAGLRQRWVMPHYLALP
jgi:dTDP-4-dehydrorhamnose reductase